MDVEVPADKEGIRGGGCEGEGGQVALNLSPKGRVIGWNVSRQEVACGGSCHGKGNMHNITREGRWGGMLCYQRAEGLVDGEKDTAGAPGRRNVLGQVKGWGGAAQVRLIGEEDLPEGVLVPVL